MAWGLEARVPFLDTDFLEVAMNIDPKEKEFKAGEKMEKYVLRKAFDDPDDPYLPRNILWRQKEQFSDGVGYAWIDSLKQAAEEKVSEAVFGTRYERWGTDVPETKEGFWYRTIFDSLFPNPASETTVKRWIPRSDWGCSTDPSGRAQKVHCAAY
jgi:asparagine synthase (glutamine-hydrolysing)